MFNDYDVTVPSTEGIEVQEVTPEEVTLWNTTTTYVLGEEQ